MRFPLLITGLLLICPAYGQTFLSAEEALALAFPGADSIEKSVEVLTDEQRKRVSESMGWSSAPPLFSFWTAMRRGAAPGATVLGHAVIHNVRGKSRPITYMAAVGPDLKLMRVELLVYRESHGGEVRRSSWRRQFVGKDLSSPLRVGRDIRNIGGATISCRAVTAGVRRALAYLSVLRPAADTGERGFRKIAVQRLPLTPGTAVEPFSRSRLLMGTPLEIKVFAAERTVAHAACEAAFEEVEKFDRVLSNWREDSELSALNRTAGQGVRRCSAEMTSFLAACLRWSHATSGAVDVSCGAQLSLWRDAEKSDRLPSAAQLALARQASGFDLLELDAADGSVRLLQSGLRLDPGAIGKGFALDRAAQVLRARGIQHALFNFGGQLFALGSRADQSPWKVSLRAAADGKGLTGSFALRSGSIATTADYERGLVIAGNRYSHVIDPRCGRPARDVLAVSVYAASATEADALSTALFVMGPEAAVQYAHDHGVSMLLHAVDGRVVRTNSFPVLDREITHCTTASGPMTNNVLDRQVSGR